MPRYLTHIKELAEIFPDGALRDRAIVLLIAHNAKVTARDLVRDVLASLGAEYAGKAELLRMDCAALEARFAESKRKLSQEMDALDRRLAADVKAVCDQADALDRASEAFQAAAALPAQINQAGSACR